MGLKPRGTLYVLKLALIRKIVSGTEYTQLIRKVLNAGLYLSAELYLQALKEDK